MRQSALAEKGEHVSVGELLRFFYGQFIHSEENGLLRDVMEAEEEQREDDADETAAL